jgi:acyl-CoA synthetase (NDP forming)
MYMGTTVKEMGAFFNPASVAVVGASKKVNKAGHVIFKNFVENKRRGVFAGELYAVNPNEDYVLGYRSYPSVAKIAGDVELIVIVVPADIVPTIMEEAAGKGVRNTVIITSGFSEVGNTALERKITQVADTAGIRVLGPNCLGVYDISTGVDMLFLPETKVLTTGDEFVATPRPMTGNIAIVTQSGAFGAASLDYLSGIQMGVSKFVSFGNKCDVAEPEMLEYFLQDDATWVILLYVEAIEEGREFMRVAEAVTRRKPIVAFKSGKSAAGARAAASHTGAIAGSDQIYDAAFAQVGVVRANDMEEFFDVGKAFALQPPAAGPKVAILTDAGGPGIMAVDRCISRGLRVEEFSDAVVDQFQQLKRDGKLPEFAANANPVDVTGSATSEMFELSAEILLTAPEVDGLIVLGLHHTPALQEDFVDRIARLVTPCTKPVVACDIGETEMAIFIRSRFEKLGIPAYASPEDAAGAMAALVHYGRYLQTADCFEDYLDACAERGQFRG